MSTRKLNQVAGWIAFVLFIFFIGHLTARGGEAELEVNLATAQEPPQAKNEDAAQIAKICAAGFIVGTQGERQILIKVVCPTTRSE